MDLEAEIKSLEKRLNEQRNSLFVLNKDYINQKKLRDYTSEGQKDSVLFEVENLHHNLKNNLQKSEFEEIVTFNLKVLLPSRDRSHSPIKEKSRCIKNSKFQMTNNENSMSACNMAEIRNSSFGKRVNG